MNNSLNMEKSAELVQFFATISSTEDLIMYVAADKERLLFCRNILEEFDQNLTSENVRQMNMTCTSKGILAGLFYSELRKVLLALNKFHDQDRNHYATLELQNDASQEDVKKAYRKLSMRYHPDRAEQGAEQPERFMEISGAYHAIMINRGNTSQQVETPWRGNNTEKPRSQSPGKKKFFFVLFALISLLIMISLYLANMFDDNALRNHPLNTDTPSSSRQNTLPEKPRDEPAVRESVLSSPTGQQENSETLLAENRPDQNNSLPIENDLETESNNDLYPQVQRIILPTDNEIYPISSSRRAVDPGTKPPASSQSTNPTGRELHKESIPMQPVQPTRAPDPVRKKMNAEKIRQPLIASPLPHSQDTDKKNRIETFNREVKISYLLKQYTKLYNHKELNPYLELFTDAATENGNPVTAEVDKYTKLFDSTETINLRLHDIDWQVNEEGFQAKGTFTGDYTYKNGDQQSYKGKIIFQLIDEQQKLKIESLVYFFEE